MQLSAGSVPGYTALHGYLTAIVIGPRDVRPHEWLAHLLEGTRLSRIEAGAHADAVHADIDAHTDAHAHCTRLLALMRRLHAHIAEDFTRPNPHLRLAALGVSQGPKTQESGPDLHTLNEWCASFLHATELRPKRWARLGPPEDDRSPLNLLWMLGTQEGRQAQIQLAYECYREDGLNEAEADRTVQRFIRLPSTQRNLLSGLREALLEDQCVLGSTAGIGGADEAALTGARAPGLRARRHDDPQSGKYNWALFARVALAKPPSKVAIGTRIPRAITR